MQSKGFATDPQVTFQVAESMDSEAEIGAGYMLVPWTSWDQWNWVRESLFSSSCDSLVAALRRITAWKSRGCLPVAIEVTARIVEIQHMDPFFRKDATNDMADITNSDGMLAMLYSIALTRLVNGFVEKVNYFDDYAHKHGKKKHSISSLADAINIPRKVVDIRHESSHRDLPSLPLLRLASIEALDWLKSHYWEPQRRTIPDVRKEIRFRLNQMVGFMKKKQHLRLNHSLLKEKCARQSMLRVCSKLSSQMSGKLAHTKKKGSLKLASKTRSIIARLYSTYPYEVVSVLLEKLQSQTLDPLVNVDAECNSKSSSSSKEPHVNFMSESKDVIHTLSKRRPGLLLTMLKEVIGAIEAKENMLFEKRELCGLSSPEQTEGHQIRLLSSLIPWLLLNLEELRNSGQISTSEEIEGLPRSIKFIPMVSLRELLRRCLLLSLSGNKHLIDSALFVAEMTRNSLLIKKVKRLHSLVSQNFDISADDTSASLEALFLQEQQSIKEAIEKLETLKSHGQTPFKTEGKKMWTVAKRWTPCPIGTLPCTFSSTPFVPDLDNYVRACMNKDAATNGHESGDRSPLGKRAHAISFPDDSPAPKRPKETSQNGKLDDVSGRAISSMKGLLLVDGIWREVGEEELLAIESNVRILV